MPLLNLKDSDRNIKIHRIMKPEYVYGLFRDRQNILVLPEKWEDPFENLVLKSPVILPSGEQGEFGFHRDFYGQCWTLNQASDAMWRIYSPEKNGIRVRTTIGKLFDSLAAALGTHAIYAAHVGRVEYKREEELKKICDDGVELMAKTLLLKRTAFRHEKEVRLLYLAGEKPTTSDGLFRYQVNPEDLVEQLMMDPRLTAAEARSMRAEIRCKLDLEDPLKDHSCTLPLKNFRLVCAESAYRELVSVTSGKCPLELCPS
jgi:hypothetical protein